MKTYNAGCDSLGCGYQVVGAEPIRVVLPFRRDLRQGSSDGSTRGKGVGGGRRGGVLKDNPITAPDTGWDADTSITGLDENDDILGMIDIASRQEEMNTLKNPTVGIAQTLLKYGQQVIQHAIDGAKQPWYKPDLPGQTARSDCQAHLQWHADNLKQYAATPNAFYPNAADLEKWVMQAYIESNAVEEGTAYEDTIWGQMWSEIAAQLAALPKEVADKVSSLIPTWLKITLGAAAAGLLLVGGAVVYNKARG